VKTFEERFGIPARDLGRRCVLLPFVRRSLLSGLGVKKLFRGGPYSAAAVPGFAVVSSGMGSAYAGDAALELAREGCRELILLGTCRFLGLPRAKVGDIVVPRASLAAEGFGPWLGEELPAWAEVPADPALVRLLAPLSGVPPVLNATVGSPFLASRKSPLLRARGVESMEMECSAVFSAAASVSAAAAAVLVVSDVAGGENGPSPENSVFAALERAGAAVRALWGEEG